MEVEPAARRDAPWCVRLCDEGSTPFVRICHPHAMNIGICNPEKHAPFVRIYNPRAMNIRICNPEKHAPFVRICNPHAMNIGICNPEKHAPFVRICNPHAMNIGICNPVTLKQSHQQMLISYTFDCKSNGTSRPAEGLKKRI